MGGTGVNGHGASRPPASAFTRIFDALLEPIRNQGLTRFKIKESFAMRAIPRCGTNLRLIAQTEPTPDSVIRRAHCTTALHVFNSKKPHIAARVPTQFGTSALAVRCLCRGGIPMFNPNQEDPLCSRNSW